MGGIVSRPSPAPPPPPPAPAPVAEPKPVESTDTQRRQAAQRRARRGGRALISGSPLGITGEALGTTTASAPMNNTLGPG